MNNDDLVSEYLKSRDPKLREQIIIKFIPIVKYVIGRLNLSIRNKNDLEDIHSAGITGLIRALEDFNASKNTKFKTYATWRVRGFILDYLRQIDIISRGDRAKLKEIERVSSELTFKLNRAPTDLEIVNEIGIDLKECHRLMELTHLNFSISFDQTHKVGEEEVRLSEIITDENGTDPFEQLSKKNLLKIVKEAIFNLPERQRLIVLLYYNDELTLLEIGKVLNLSESRVSRLLGKAILNIRKELKKQKIQLFQI
ncbi:MAG: FliA/WhiG family RNA polymerase sigma factor [bacterium]